MVRGLRSAVQRVLCRGAKAESEQLNCLLQFPERVQINMTDISNVPNQNKEPKYQGHVLDKLTLLSNEAVMEEEPTQPSSSQTGKSALPQAALCLCGFVFFFFLLKRFNQVTLSAALFFKKCFFCFLPEIFAHLTLLAV